MVASDAVSCGVVGSSDVGDTPDPDPDPDSKLVNVSDSSTHILCRPSVVGSSAPEPDPDTEIMK